MEPRIPQMYLRWRATQETMVPYLSGWDETVAELALHGLNLYHFVDLIEESEKGGEHSMSFGEYVLHKVDKAITVMRGEREYREYRITGVLSDLLAIDEYAESTKNEGRSYIGFVRRERQG